MLGGSDMKKQNKGNLNATSEKSQIPKDLLDNLSFTDSAKQLEELKQQIFNVREIKNHKIATIKQALENNEYSISNKHIAEKLIEDYQFAEEEELA